MRAAATRILLGAVPFAAPAPTAVAQCQLCVPGALAEGEAECPAADFTNGGCETDPPTFVDLPCGEPVTVCGTYGTFCAELPGAGCAVTRRDTDWYRITVTEGQLPLTITWRATGPLTTRVSVYDGTATCAQPPSLVVTAVAGSCQEARVTTTITEAGSWYLFLRQDDTEIICGQVYNATLDGYDCEVVAVDPVTVAGGRGLHFGPAIPNPFIRGTTVSLETAFAGAHVVDVVTITGAFVRRLHAGPLEAGSHDLTWDGTDAGGRPVANGVYLTVARGPGGVTATKVLSAR